MFTPNLGEMIQFVEHIFQMGLVQPLPRHTFWQICWWIERNCALQLQIVFLWMLSDGPVEGSWCRDISSLRSGKCCMRCIHIMCYSIQIKSSVLCFWHFLDHNLQVKTMLTRNPQNRPRARELLAKNSYARAGRPAKGCCSCVRWIWGDGDDVRF